MRGFPSGPHCVSHQAGRAVPVRHHGHVADERRRRCVEPHGAVQAGVVEEVVEVPLPEALRGVLDNARWDGLETQLVVHHGGDPDLVTRGHEAGHVGLEWCVAPLMLGDLRVPDPDHRPMGRGVEAQNDALAVPAAWDAGRGLIPRIANVVTGGRVGEDIVVARRDRRLHGVGQGAGEPPRATSGTDRVELELPQARQRLAFTGPRVLGPKHHVLLFGCVPGSTSAVRPVPSIQAC